MSGDALRLAILAGGLALALTIGPCLIWAPGGWDQRVRFAAMLGYGVVTIGGQVNNLHTPLRWTTWALAVVTVLALVGMVGYLHKQWLAIRDAVRRVRGRS